MHMGGSSGVLYYNMTAVVESLLTNRAGVASWCFVVLIGMFSDVILLEVVSSVKSIGPTLNKKKLPD